jgi:hypothetical protein
MNSIRGYTTGFEKFASVCRAANWSFPPKQLSATGFSDKPGLLRLMFLRSNDHSHHDLRL